MSLARLGRFGTWHNRRHTPPRTSNEIAAKTATTSRHTPDPDPAVPPGREHRPRTKGAENTKFVEELTRPEFRAPNVDIG